MADRTLIVCAVLLSQAYFSKSLPPIISFTPPSPLVLTPNDTQTGGTGRTLAITCTQPAGGILKSLVLTRNSSSSAMVTLIFANSEPPPDGTNGVPVISGNIQGAAATGSLIQRTITLTYSQASCDHSGIYTCSSIVFQDGVYFILEASQSYNVTDLSLSPTISFIPQSPLVLTPNDTQTGGTGRTLAITCAQPACGTLKSLVLTRNSSSSAMVTLIYAKSEPPPDGTNGVPVISGNIQGAAATGSLTQRAITLTYSQASCDHSGIYTCSSVVYKNGIYYSFEASNSYNVTVQPGKAVVAVVGIPSGGTRFVAGDAVTFICVVDVGTIESTMTEVDFFWQYEDLAGSNIFQNYSNLDDIDNTETPIVGQRCQTQTRISKLRRNLTIEDSYRQYRCYITKGGQSYLDLAGSADIVEVKSNHVPPNVSFVPQSPGNYVSPILSFGPQSPLVLTPNDTQTGGTGRTLAITCAQPAGGTLRSLVLTRNRNSSALVTLLYANTDSALNGTNGVPVIGGNIAGAVASGRLAQRNITLTYSQALCDHTGIYTCSSTVFENNLTSTLETSQNYSVTVGPGKAVLTVTSNKTSAWYEVGDIVILRCTVDVGTVESTLTKVDFIWQYKDPDGSQLFRNYSMLDDIDNTEALAVGQKCQTQTRLSKLRRNLTMEDSCRQYRCYIRKGGLPYIDLAGSVQITKMKSECSPVHPGHTNMAAVTGPPGVVWCLLLDLVIYTCTVIVGTFILL